MGFPLNEYLTYGGRYSLSQDKISLSKALYYTDPDGADGPEPAECDPLKAGRYLCDEIGTRLTSSIGHSLFYDDTDGIHPTRGQRVSFSQDFAGLGGDVKYVRTRADGTKYKSFGSWILSGHLEGGYIHALQKSPGPGRDPIRLTDRFFGSQMRGFDIRGIGPRIIRIPYDAAGNLTDVDLDNVESSSGDRLISDALGGHAYYMGRIELEVPTSSSIRSLGLRPSAFLDIGSIWGLTTPELIDIPGVCNPLTPDNDQIILEPGQGAADCPAGSDPDEPIYTFSPGYKEIFLGNSPKPRISIGVGVNWVSPFGPLRIDIAKALVKQKGDDTKLFSFNVGTQF